METHDYEATPPESLKVFKNKMRGWSKEKKKEFVIDFGP